MANILMYTIEEYNDKYFKILNGLYNDFKQRAFDDYKFELAPLEYDDFVRSLQEGLLECMILFEDNIPTAFLVYTTVISESIELNLIHCISDENMNYKRRLLLEKFLEKNKDLIKQKVVTYPLLGKQYDFMYEITKYGFKIAGQSVVRFALNNLESLKIIKNLELPQLEQDYEIGNWKHEYFDRAVDLIYHAFKYTSDAEFDPRFKTIKGTVDIIEKITGGVYGEFLAEQTKVLLYRKKPVGFCFANLTGPKIANVPLVGVNRRHRGKGFSNFLLKATVEDILNTAMNRGWELKEINASVDTNNTPAVKMYTKIGFLEDYSYPQAYRPLN